MSSLWLGAAVGCVVVASVFLVVAPRAAHDGGWGGVRAIVLRWGHSLTWGLLAVAALARFMGLPHVAAVSAALGACAYVTFIVAVLSSKRSIG